MTELEFGVGDDDAGFFCDASAGTVNRQTAQAQFLRGGRAQCFTHMIEGNVLVVAGLGLGGRREDRGIQPITLA
jgi:hypothetical protein